MAIDATTSAAASATAPTDSGALGKARLATSFDTFMKLLTTQLKNQDPLSPLDSNQFTQQLVQMTGVEQQLYTNDLLKKLVTNSGTDLGGAVNVIGKEVTSSASEANLLGGAARWSFKLDREASDLKIEVLDSSGRTVHAEAPSDRSAGDHSFTWDGRDLSGKQRADGEAFTLRITARDSASAVVPSSVFIKGIATGVEQASDGSTLVTINGTKAAWGSITQITAPPAKTPTPTT